MTKKDYIVTAKVINKCLGNIADPDDPTFFPNRFEFEAIQNVAHGLADVFKADNPRFDRETFLTACGL